MRLLSIREPSQHELEELQAFYRTTREARLRTRAQMILLALEQHLTAAKIALIGRGAAG